MPYRPCENGCGRDIRATFRFCGEDDCKPPTPKPKVEQATPMPIQMNRATGDEDRLDFGGG